jgi:phosphatidylserine/phosphatidylglycerophosphate/cardiolipin synthase-like enzyme
MSATTYSTDTLGARPTALFLKPHEARIDDPTGTPDEAPFPMREGCRVTPLIEAADMYPALEQLVLSATSHVQLAFRIFDPTTRARSDEARALGLDDWTAIIRRVVMSGVNVRLLLTDFEPVMAHDLHAGSWKTFHVLRDMSATLPTDKRGDFEMVVIQHEGELGWGWRHLLRLPIRFQIARVLDELHQREHDIEALIHARPGLWRRHRIEGGHARHRPGPPPRIWPSTYHQKFAVVDDRIAILGGLDVNERRWDDPRHAQPAPQTWHDISCRLEGPAVADCAEHFRRLWNAEMPRFREIAAEWMDGTDRKLVLEPLDPIEREPVPPPAAGEARVQILRTKSRRDPRLFATGPRPHIRELEAAHRKIIFAANRLLYVEAQFLRYRPAARWISERARQMPDLKVIMLLPNAPEEVAFEGNKHAAHRHGEWLQAKAIEHLRRRLGDRIGIFSLARPAPATPEEKEYAPDRGTAFGSGLIHVHSKLLIADDDACLVSSANINGRSFKWDTEFGMLWQDEPTIRRFRQRLWQQLLDLPGLADFPLEEALDRWRAIATNNVRVDPNDRQGFVVPHQIGRTKRFGRSFWFVPDDLV